MEDYVHRIGRTGRAGSTGQATSFYTDRDMVTQVLSCFNIYLYTWIFLLSLMQCCPVVFGSTDKESNSGC